MYFVRIGLIVLNDILKYIFSMKWRYLLVSLCRDHSVYDIIIYIYSICMTIEKER